MSELPQWTPDYVENLYRSHPYPFDAFKTIASVHNAILAAAQKQRDDFRRALEQRVGEADELWWEKEIFLPAYECPKCDEWIEIVPIKEKGTFRCLYCGEVLRLDVDAEFKDGLWHDRSRLVTAGSHWDEQ